MSPREQRTKTEMTDEEFRQHVLEILQSELGADGFARFLRVYRPGKGDYTRDRHKWLSGVTVDRIMEDIKAHRKKSA